MSGTSSDNDWQLLTTSGRYNEWQRMTTSDNEWQQVVQRGTMSATTRDRDWQGNTASRHFS